MITYIIRRLFIGIIVLIIVTLIVFFAMRLLPGDPLTIFIGQQGASGTMSEAQKEALRHEYGLDKPIMMQYFSWFGGLFTGDLGTSIYYHEDVGKLLGKRFPITLHLGLLSFVIANLVGILLGLFAGIRRGTWIDATSTTLANIGITIPQFWLGILLIYSLGLKLHLLPIYGYTSPFDDLWMSTKQLIMPVACLAVTERSVIIVHALKNSLIPVITLMGLGLGMVFGGAVLVETVFAIPGIGRLLVNSVFAQDYVVVQSGTLVIAFIVIISNLLVDISYGWLDPRIRYG